MMQKKPQTDALEASTSKNIYGRILFLRYMPQAVHRGWVSENGGMFFLTGAGIDAGKELVEKDAALRAMYDEAPDKEKGGLLMVFLLQKLSEGEAG